MKIIGTSARNLKYLLLFHSLDFFFAFLSLITFYSSLFFFSPLFSYLNFSHSLSSLSSSSSSSSFFPTILIICSYPQMLKSSSLSIISTILSSLISLLSYSLVFPSDLYRRREVQLAVTLVTKLSAYSEADREAFTEKSRTEACELSGELRRQ